MGERESGLGIGRDPVKLILILDEIKLDFIQLKPISAAIGALIAFEATPNLCRAVRWRKEPADSPLRQYFEEAKSYLVALNKMQQHMEGHDLPEQPDNDADDENSVTTYNLKGILHACEDVLTILDRIMPEDTFKSLK